MFNTRFYYTGLLTALLLLSACNNQPAETVTANTTNEESQQKIKGRWQLDGTTAEELRSLSMTIDNFYLLNKKKFENTGAYQEFGLLLENHIKRIDTYCTLTNDCKQDLYVRLDSIKAEVPVLSKGNMEEGKAALVRVKNIWSGVDSTFNYNN
ncbi:MAG: hypothetical protein U0V74_14585 [Chitinophagales bacterium]